MGHQQQRYLAVRKSSTVALDPLTPWMLVAYIIVNLLGTIYLLLNYKDNPKLAGLSSGVIWSAFVVQIIAFFAIVMPLVWLGMFITGKIMKFELPGAAYLRAGSIAAAPTVIPALAAYLPPNFVLRLLAVLAVIPIAFYLAMNLFEMSWSETFLSAVFCIPLFLVGGVIMFMLVGAVMAGGMISEEMAKNTSKSSYSSSSSGNSERAAPSPPVDRDLAKLESLQTRVNNLADDTFKRTTREQLTTRITAFRDELENLKASKGDTDQWQHVSNQLVELTEKAAALPSEDPKRVVYTPLSAKEAWLAPPDAEKEVSIGEFLITPPVDFRLSLKPEESGPDKLAWSKSSAWFSIKLVPAGDPKQLRPWIAPDWVLSRAGSAASKKLFTLESEEAEPEIGTIADVTFAKVASGTGSWKKIIYAGRAGDSWIVATLSPGSNADVESAMESAVKTLRKGDPAEAKKDPFSPAKLVARLADDPENATRLIRANAGAGLEDAMLAALESQDSNVQAGALKILSDVATDKSVETLRKFAAAPESAKHTPARKALQRLRPQEFDEISAAVLDLKASDRDRVNAALKKLAAAQPDPNRPEVAKAIEPLFLAQDFWTREAATSAMVVWVNADSVPRLLPMLDEGSASAPRAAAMRALSLTKDKRAVLPIVRWIIKSPEETVKALILMGPVAEDEVAKLLKERDNTVRKNAARILNEIGSQKSLIALTRASTDPRDAAAAAAAKQALASVRERAKLAPATKPVASTKPSAATKPMKP